MTPSEANEWIGVVFSAVLVVTFVALIVATCIYLIRSTRNRN